MSEMASRAELAVAVARRWIGTPYRHQASTEGVGTDCLGLLRGVWREVYGFEPEVAPPYTADWSETSRREALLEAAARNMTQMPSRQMATGDVLLFRMRTRAVAKHIGIFCHDRRGAPGFVHAYSGKGVVETPLSAAWAAKVAAVFRLP